jgi:hypothetical protein
MSATRGRWLPLLGAVLVAAVPVAFAPGQEASGSWLL